MSIAIRNEIQRIETTEAGVVAHFKRSIMAAEHTYGNMIRDLKAKCQHKERLSNIHRVPMGLCEYCDSILT